MASESGIRERHPPSHRNTKAPTGFARRAFDVDAQREQLLLGLEQAGRTRMPEVLRFDRFKPMVEDELPDLGLPPLRFVAHPSAPTPTAALAAVRGPFALALVVSWSAVALALLLLGRWLTMDGPGFTSVVQGGIRFNTYVGLAAAEALQGLSLEADQASEAGLVTVAMDDIDWEDELRMAVEERAGFSPDALTGLEANIRFAGPETMESKIFARLSAWQNWIFQRPNAVGGEGALQLYGSGRRPVFDRDRV